MEPNLITKLQELQEWFLIHDVGHKEIYLMGLLIFSSLLIVLLAKKIKVPIVVGYVFLGIILSVDIIDSLPFISSTVTEWYAFIIESFDFIPQIALAFIAFTIGSELSVKIIRKMGKTIFYIVILQALAAFFLVTSGLLAIGMELYLALIFGAIASATAPAATVMVINEYNASVPVTSMIMAVVGIDDAIALILFSLINPLAYILYSGHGNLSLYNSLGIPLLEITVSLLAGLGIGYISQKLITNFEDKTKKVLTVVSTIVGATAISLYFHLSPLITSMAIGFAYRNYSRKNLGISNYLETLTIPLYAVFFILAGTEIKFSSIASTGFLIIAAVYTITRVIGKIGGSSLAASMAGASDKIKKYVGLGLLPQSGVAIALAYSVQRQYSANPQVGLLVFNIILFTSVLTEVFGPLATKYALFKSGEAENTTKNTKSKTNF